MKIELRLIFQKNAFNGDSFVEKIIDENLIEFPFTIITSTSLGLVRSKFEKSYFNDIKNIGYDIHLSLENNSYEGNTFSIKNTGIGSSFQVLNWIVDENTYNGINPISLFSLPEFICGYAFDSEFVAWQSEQMINNYKFFNRDLSKVKTTYDKVREENIIDISLNPGREVLLPNFWLLSSWKMWYGKNFYQYVSKDTLQSFKSAYKMEQINDFIHINLYEKVFESEKKENLQILKQFRDWCEFDLLEQKLLGLPTKPKESNNWGSKFLSFFK